MHTACTVLLQIIQLRVKPIGIVPWVVVVRFAIFGFVHPIFFSHRSKIYRMPLSAKL